MCSCEAWAGMQSTTCIGIFVSLAPHEGRLLDYFKVSIGPFIFRATPARQAGDQGQRGERVGQLGFRYCGFLLVAAALVRCMRTRTYPRTQSGMRPCNLAKILRDLAWNPGRCAQGGWRGREF